MQFFLVYIVYFNIGEERDALHYGILIFWEYYKFLRECNFILLILDVNLEFSMNGPDITVNFVFFKRIVRLEIAKKLSIS